MSDTIFELKATANDGTEVDLGAYAGKVLLVANTASKCGFTPQYAGLEALHRKYGDRGLVVLGFPCDQFGHQEPDGDAEIAAFCQRNFGVGFPLMAKVEVNGSKVHPVFKLLKKQAPGLLGGGIKWNFTKFLVSRDGKTVVRFASADTPESMDAAVAAALDA